MYVNPPMTDTALFANYMGGGVGFMPGMGQVGAGLVMVLVWADSTQRKRVMLHLWLLI